MAAIRPDQAKTGAAGAITGTPETQVTPRPGRYEIDTSCSAVTFGSLLYSRSFLRAPEIVKPRS